MLDVDIGHQRADLLPQDPTERRGHGIDHGDVETPPPTGGSDLCADEACTDDSDSRRASVERGPQRVCVIEGSQDVHARHVLGAGQGATAGASGDHHCVDGVVAVRGREGSGGEVESRGSNAEPKV